MKKSPEIDYAILYAQFQAPIAVLDCGDRCAPYNEYGAPFCCDTRHMVPTAYLSEWQYLAANTDLWHEWDGDGDLEIARELRSQAPENQVLIACLGYRFCQREFRSMTCRAFPFFPYVDRQGEFLGLSVYWEYEDRCWVISNLQVVTPEYLAEFIRVYDFLFELDPEERENFRRYSSLMRRVFGRRHRAIPLLHRNGFSYRVTPRNGRMRRIDAEKLQKFGPYRIAAALPFLDGT